MAQVIFTQNLQRHVACDACSAQGRTVREVLDGVFTANPAARGYLLDDQGALRRHMVVFVNGRQIRDRTTLTDPVEENANVYVMQALSGG